MVTRGKPFPTYVVERVDNPHPPGTHTVPVVNPSLLFGGTANNTNYGGGVIVMAGAAVEPTGNPPANGALVWSTGNALKARFADGTILNLDQQAGIANADGSLADVTSKFNTLIASMETLGLLATV